VLGETEKSSTKATTVKSDAKMALTAHGTNSSANCSESREGVSEWTHTKRTHNDVSRNACCKSLYRRLKANIHSQENDGLSLSWPLLKDTPGMPS